MTRNEVLEKFESLSPEEQKRILWIAIDEMQTHNGRTKVECLALAMNEKID